MRIGEVEIAGKIYGVMIAPDAIMVDGTEYPFEIHAEPPTIWLNPSDPLQAAVRLAEWVSRRRVRQARLIPVSDALGD